MATAVATEREARLPAAPATGRPAAGLFEPRTGGVSLEDSILRTWEDLTGVGSAGCPVCGGRLPSATACDSCGSELG